MVHILVIIKLQVIASLINLLDTKGKCKNVKFQADDSFMFYVNVNMMTFHITHYTQVNIKCLTQQATTPLSSAEKHLVSRFPGTELRSCN